MLNVRDIDIKQWNEYSKAHIDCDVCFGSDTLNVGPMESFHIEGSTVIMLNDDYFCGIRATHFVIMWGYSEEDNLPRAVVMGNHKGLFRMVSFPISDKPIKL